MYRRCCSPAPTKHSILTRRSRSDQAKSLFISSVRASLPALLAAAVVSK